ncbi:helix-turn-helix transcriptional regulator [Mycolicibacterium sp. D5.8-2]|uniref:helix-turn-helix domain-containing protein n=1 Tax=Mycolicibacterium sp. D5.8-2 TaxID=3085903 RepID=UPI00298CE486|nr:helix-turn-helix transcriptional regulator [Mycolicibacterium sp. D5.8-2]MDW5612088.1 helix-turn-helix transcriptional regulator [Mycolicibacterium sp. D5.8-2]
MESDSVVGKRIESLRARAGLSQEELSKRLRDAGLNWSQGTLSRVETGSRPMRFVEALVVANALGVEVAELTPFGGGLTYIYRRQLDLLDERQWAVYRAKNELHSAEVTVQLLRFAVELSRGSRTDYVLHIRPHQFVGYISHQMSAGSTERVLALLGVDEAVAYSRFEDVDLAVESQVEAKDDEMSDEDYDALRDEVERKVRNEIVDEIFRESFPFVRCDYPASDASEFAIDFPTPVVDGIDTSDFQRKPRYPVVTNLRHGR